MLLKIISFLVILVSGNNSTNSGVEYAILRNFEASETIEGITTERVSNFNLSFDFELYFNIYDQNDSLEDTLVYENNLYFTNSLNIYNDNITYQTVDIYFIPGVNRVISYNSDIEFIFNIDVQVIVSYNTRLEQGKTFSRTFNITGSYYVEQEDTTFNLLYDLSYATEYKFKLNNSEYQEGYDEGYDDGYGDGYGEGESEGFIRGKDEGYDEGYDDGYDDGYDEGLINGDTEETIFTFLNGVFRAVDEFLSIEIIPGIELWGIVLIPIVFGVLSFFLNLWR